MQLEWKWCCVYSWWFSPQDEQIKCRVSGMKADSLIQNVSPVCKGKCLEVFLNNKQHFKMFSVIRSKLTWYGKMKKKKSNDMTTLISCMVTTGKEIELAQVEN